MKCYKLILYTAFFLLPFLSAAQSDTLNRTDSKGKKQGYWKKYDNGLLQYEGRFDNDIPTGEFRYYHENGEIKSVSNFMNGTHRVKTTLFHPNGKKSAEGLFVDQIKDGEWLYYSDKGTLIRKESYKKGIKHGEWKTYSAQTGLLLVEENYDSGLLNGIRKTYYTDGDIQTSISYINGKKNGIAETYRLEKKLASRGLYHQNFMTGVWEFYDDTQKKRREVEFMNDEPLKTYLYFYQGNVPQKLNQSVIAYFQKTGDQLQVVTTENKVLVVNEIFEELKYWVDALDFIQITPSIMASYGALKGYRDLGDGEIVVLLEPAPSHDIIAKDDFARLVISLFDNSKPQLD